MSSFFEKLKKGMGAEETVETKEEAKEKPPKIKRSAEFTASPQNEKVVLTKELKIETEPTEPVKKKRVAPTIESKPVEKMEVKKTARPSFTIQNLGGEVGELAVDIYQTEKDLVIQTAIAGVKPEDLDISMERDVITIKGTRQKPSEEDGDYFTQECYWGPFAREMILPVEVDSGRAEATMREGVLIIRMPKIQRNKKRQISVKG